MKWHIITDSSSDLNDFEIQEIWHKAKIKIMPTRGLCSYYAEKNGVIVGFWGKHIFDKNGKLLKSASENIASYI